MTLNCMPTPLGTVLNYKKLRHQCTLDWLIPLNPSKSGILNMGYNNPVMTYDINNIQVPETNEQVDLDNTILSDLTWSKQVVKATRNANYELYTIKKTFFTPSIKQVGSMYLTHVRSHLQFGIAA